MSSYVSPTYVSPCEPKPTDRSCHGLPGDGLPWECSSTFKPLPLKQEVVTTNGNCLSGAINSPFIHTTYSVPSSLSTLKGSTPPPPPPQPPPMSEALAQPSYGIPVQPSKSKGKGE